MTMLYNGEPNIKTVEVVPGSADDPFTDPSKVSLTGALASPAAPPNGQTNPGPVDGTNPSTPNPNPAVQQAPAPGTDEARLKALLDQALAEANEAAEQRIRQAQSAADKRVAAYEKQIREAQEAQRVAERNAKLNADDLTDEEKDILRKSYELEDWEARLESREEADDEFHRSVYAVALAQDYAQFGVTEEALVDLDTPEAMDEVVRQAELEYYRNGGVVAPTPGVTEAGATAVTPTRTAPAGASAPSDLAGNGAPATPIQFNTEPGVDAMSANLKNMKWESLPLPQ
jgi:hypothetical protein